MEKVYLIEDDKYLGRVYERAFKFAGYEVSLALDGETAQRELTEADSVPSAIVMDIMMPKLNGFDLLTVLRKDVRFDKVPIVILTNSFQEHDSERFLSVGADLYLIKIEQQTKDVVQKVKELINNGRPIANKA